MITLDPILDIAARVARALPPLRGRGALAQRISRSPSSREGMWHIRMEKGHVLDVPRASLQTWGAAFTGHYDDEEIDLINRFIVPDGLVLDVGACFGFYAVPLGIEAQRRNAYLAAFEPVPSNFALLQRNLSANGLAKNVVALPVALGERVLSRKMWVEPGGAGNAVLINDQLERLNWEMDRLDVPVQPLDEVELPPPLAGRRCCVVKMDIEGAELEAMNGGRKFFAEHRPVVLGEFNTFFLEKNRLEPNVVQIWADDNGYSCFEIRLARTSALSDRRRIGLRPLTRYSLRGTNSLLLVPKEHPIQQGSEWATLVIS